MAVLHTKDTDGFVSDALNDEPEIAGEGHAILARAVSSQHVQPQSAMAVEMAKFINGPDHR